MSEETTAEDSGKPKDIEIGFKCKDDMDRDAKYFELGTKFLADCYVLLGYHITESHQTIGELEPEVRKAVNLLALSTIWRMTRIMDNDLVHKDRQVPSNPD